jgi:bifunctional UDP-N-acetylglucosamine pyrophosphorylase/glucosamine-1-phosphate N-acetyltransferase
MNVNVIILAGGKSSRIKMECPKILLNLAGKPLIDYVLSTVKQINPLSIKVVVPENERIIDHMKSQKISYSIQDLPRGTAHALLTGLKDFSDKDVILVLNGDVPLITPSTLEYFINNYYDDEKISIISTELEDPEQYGRIIRDDKKNFIKIIEERDLISEDLKQIKEVNTGIYIGRAEKFFERLANIKNSNNQKEYYLTDCLRAGDIVYLNRNSDEFLGINTLEDFSKVAKIIWLQRAKKLMNQGVCIFDPQNFYVDETVQIEPNVTIYPNVSINGKTSIMKHTSIYSGCRIVDSYIGEGCTILDNTLIISSEVGNNCSVGPMAHLRPATILKGGNRIGNFVETKKVSIGKKTKASHLTYLGDAIIGDSVNIGCGTITCNYDGFNKNITTIGNNSFIGSDVQFVAPVKIGSNVIVAAGSTITEDVPDNALAIARAKQINKSNWFIRWCERLKKK